MGSRALGWCPFACLTVVVRGGRPPLGFVVEGTGEYYCYPSLCARIVGAAGGLHIPVVNAQGCGNIVSRLEEQLQSLVLLYNPFEIVVTIDLRDVLSQDMFDSCEDLVHELSQRARAWLEQAGSDSRLCPLPERISIVIQVQKFESWILADVESLWPNHLRRRTSQIGDVDHAVDDPARWLKDHLIPFQDIKNPHDAKSIISVLNPDVMRTNSRSFDKLYREIQDSYQRWLATLCP